VSNATLLVVHGPNRGTRYPVDAAGNELIVGRGAGCNIRLDDTEVSRRHLRIHCSDDRFSIKDLNSANGTRVNGRFVESATLNHGDAIRIGATLLSFQMLDLTVATTESVGQVQLVDDTAAEQQSAIVQSVPAEPMSALTVHHAEVHDARLLHRIAEELVRPTHTQETLLREILQLVLSAIGADRGCFLLKDPSGNLKPAAFRRRIESSGTGAQESFSRSISNYVLEKGQAVRTSDAAKDTRFGGESIASSGVREVICAPMRGHEELLGVLYVDTISNAVIPGFATSSRLTDDHLSSVLAVARQSALAVEARQFHDAFLKAERFAAMGQTVAVISHHIKNILQGMKGGGFLIAKGLEDAKPEMVMEGWAVVERNQARIYELVTDMLSFSRDRVPQLQPANLNEICKEVSDLVAHRAAESSVAFTFQPQNDLPIAAFDIESIHRAVLNIASNAIDAVHQIEGGAVVLQTGYDRDKDMMLVAISDNGPGIPDEQREIVFNLFESSKGSRGTGIGLPVSRKIIREHGGRIHIDTQPGAGTRFVLSWPRGNPDAQAASPAE
jgi:two-component system NtrC family sensor kinase